MGRQKTADLGWQPGSQCASVLHAWMSIVCCQQNMDTGGDDGDEGAVCRTDGVNTGSHGIHHHDVK